MDAQSYEVDHFKDYHRLKYSYLSHTFESNHLLVFPVNGMMLIISITEKDVLLSVSEHLSYLVNQIPFHLLYPDWFHAFAILTFIFNSFDYFDAGSVCN